MTIELWATAQSTRSQRVFFTLFELKIPYNLHNIEFQKGDHKASAYVADHHPFGRVPAIQDGDFKLFESQAICRYLAAKYPGALSAPTDPKALAIQDEVASVNAYYFDPAASGLGFQKLFRHFMGLGDGDPKEIERLEGELGESLDYFESVLADQTYLGGNEFSVVDIFVAPWINFLPHIKLEKVLDSRPKLTAWWAKVSSRPAWKETAALLAHH